MGTPNQVGRVVDALSEFVPLDAIAMHFHDTRGTALANVLAALQSGIAIFDASSGGLGGCPFAPGATGNVATEDLLYMLAGMGIETGVDLAAVRAASRFIATRAGPRPLTFTRVQRTRSRREPLGMNRAKFPAVVAADLDGRVLVDNGAGAQLPEQSLERMNRFATYDNAPKGRGFGRAQTRPTN